MSKIGAETVEMDSGDVVWLHPAKDEDVKHVLSQSESHDDGRSNFIWVRLPNGDLILGVYPQGTTYKDVEVAAEHPDW